MGLTSQARRAPRPDAGRRWRTAVVLAAILLGSMQAWGDGDEWQAGAGGFGSVRAFNAKPVGSLELVHRTAWPGVGLTAATDLSVDGRYVGAGVLFYTPLNQPFSTSLSFAPGYWSNHQEINLGSQLEFRSSAAVFWRLRRGYRAGLTFSHYSNGGLARRNPGGEALRLSLGIPFGP
jgi:hypothetical protein